MSIKYFSEGRAPPSALPSRLIKIGAKAISTGSYVAVQMAEIVIPRNLFANIPQFIAEQRPPRVTLIA